MSKADLVNVLETVRNSTEAIPVVIPEEWDEQEKIAKLEEMKVR